MFLVADDEGGVAVAEEVAGAFVPLVEGLGVAAVQVAQPDGEQVLVRLQDQVVMVRHQAERVAVPVRAPRHSREQHEEEAAVVVVAGDRDAVHATSRHVEDRALGEVATRQPWHLANVARCGHGSTAGDNSTHSWHT